jgi:hypothetical protein
VIAEGRSDGEVMSPTTACRTWPAPWIECLHSPIPGSIIKSATSDIKQGQFIIFAACRGKFDLDTAVRFALEEEETPPADGALAAS